MEDTIRATMTSPIFKSSDGTALSSYQVSQLYQRGISGLPLAGANVIGWWPLNGNANDHSGNGDNGAPNQVAFTLPPYYTRDSVLSGNTTA